MLDSWKTKFRNLVCYASAARTATPTVQADQDNRGFRGIRVTVVVSAVPGSAPSVVFTIEGKDAAGNYYTILASAAVTAVGTTVLTVFPGSAVSANVSANAYLAATWRLKAVHGNANSVTYAASAELFP